MSKILGKNETGYGILIEHDAGYIDLELNPTLVTESTKFKFDPDKPVLVNCILQKWGVKNKNGRIYPKEVLMREVDNYVKNMVENSSAISEADHPDSSVVSLNNVSHLIKKTWWGSGENQNVLFGQIEIITSPAYMRNGIVCMIGDKIVEYLKRGIRLGISSRGIGTLKQVNGDNIVQDDFELICFDLVASPSTPGAYLFPEMTSFNGLGESHVSNKNSINEYDNVLNVLNKFLIK